MARGLPSTILLRLAETKNPNIGSVFLPVLSFFMNKGPDNTPSKRLYP